MVRLGTMPQVIKPAIMSEDVKPSIMPDLIPNVVAFSDEDLTKAATQSHKVGWDDDHDDWDHDHDYDGWPHDHTYNPGHSKQGGGSSVRAGAFHLRCPAPGFFCESTLIDYSSPRSETHSSPKETGTIASGTTIALIPIKSSFSQAFSSGSGLLPEGNVLSKPKGNVWSKSGAIDIGGGGANKVATEMSRAFGDGIGGDGGGDGGCGGGSSGCQPQNNYFLCPSSSDPRPIKIAICLQSGCEKNYCLGGGPATVPQDGLAGGDGLYCGKTILDELNNGDRDRGEYVRDNLYYFAGNPWR